MALNTSGRCTLCAGTVRNIPHKRHTTQTLTTIHNDTCPALNRGRTERKRNHD